MRAAAQTEGGDPVLVPVAPCRVLDTRFMPPADAGEELARRIDIAGTRCGGFVPAAAVAYRVRVTRFDRTFLLKE